MKKLIILLLLCIPAMSQSMEDSYENPNKPLIKKPLITLPSTNVLTRRLQEAGFSDFVEKTDIFQKIGKQRKSPWKIYLLIDRALYQVYEQNSSDSKKAHEMQMKKLDITNLILKDFPEAIEWLAQTGIVLKTSEEE